ncbi:MAG TPA: BON domain-containing protein [Verrucomicrobiae bacterium]|nr:BON domain-containing protein [Verrucomicrobiae bacterium]
MQTNPKRLILSACLIITIACAALAGCKSDNRPSETRQDDKKTASRIKKALDDAPAYKLSEVRVEVYDSVAQLSGFTDTKEQKQYAGEIASNTPGVRQVINNIAMKPTEAVTPTGYGYGRQYPPPPTTANPPPTVNQPVPVQPAPAVNPAPTTGNQPATVSPPPSNQRNTEGLGSPNRQNENISNPNQP